MNVAMLLRNLRLVRQMDLGVAGLDHRHARTNQRHRLLAIEAGADTCGKIGILNFMHGRHLKLR